MSPVSRLVVKVTSLSFIVRPFPAAIFPIVASKKLSPFPEAGKSLVKDIPDSAQPVGIKRREN